MATASKRLVLTDDGTLDTVFECIDCGGQERYTFTPSGQRYDGGYRRFVAWAIEDAEEQHVCP